MQLNVLNVIRNSYTRENRSFNFWFTKIMKKITKKQSELKTFSHRLRRMRKNKVIIFFSYVTTFITISRETQETNSKQELQDSFLLPWGYKKLVKNKFKICSNFQPVFVVFLVFFHKQSQLTHPDYLHAHFNCFLMLSPCKFKVGFSHKTLQVLG